MENNVVPTWTLQSRSVFLASLVAMLVGTALFGWAIFRAREPSWQARIITSGEIRPALIVLPLAGGDLAVSQGMVLQSQLVRGLHFVPREAFVEAGNLQGCPAAYQGNAPSFCLSAVEIAAYANAVTKAENQARRARLTDCYSIETVVRPIIPCTGFRLPTEREWREFTRPIPGDASYKGRFREYVGVGRTELVQGEDNSALILFRTGGKHLLQVPSRDSRIPFRLVRSFR